jgi:hypothetical protein
VRLARLGGEMQFLEGDICLRRARALLRSPLLRVAREWGQDAVHARALVLVQVATDAGLRGCLSTVWPVSPEITLLMRHPEIRFSTSAWYPSQRAAARPYRLGAPKRLPRANLVARRASSPSRDAGRRGRACPDRDGRLWTPS